MLFVWGVLNMLTNFGEDLSGPKKDLLISSCPEKDILQQWS